MRRSTRTKPASSNRQYRFSVVVVKEKRAHWAYVPDLPGVYGQGRTPLAAKHDLREALSLYIEDCVASGDPVPTSAAQIVNVDTLSFAVNA
jgi:predicted RNase H-like HicB family nuclease